MEKLNHKVVLATTLLIPAVLLSVLCLVSGDRAWLRLPVELLIVVVPVIALHSYCKKKDRLVTTALYLFPALVSLMEICSAWRVCPESFGGEMKCIFVMLISVLQLMSFVLWRTVVYFSDLKNMMAGNDVWKTVRMKSDIAYLSAIFMVFSFLFLSLLFRLPYGVQLVWSFSLVVITGMLLARLFTNRIFVFMKKKENAILGCIRSSGRIVSSDNIDPVYKEVYCRVLDYFENEKPYLNERLTVEDVAINVFTNKVYVSRAINYMTDMNYCQFVNNYRIRFSMQEFHRRPDMRIGELATASGFHNMVSFNMAFHSIVGSSPSEWCRIERSKMTRMKK